MKFRLPILEVLDEIKDPQNPERSLLDVVIHHLYIVHKMSTPAISTLLTMSSTEVYRRIPRKDRKYARSKEDFESLVEEVTQQLSDDKCPKEIAYDLGVSKSKIYRICKVIKNRKANIHLGSCSR